MTWRDDLVPASYNGAEFHVEVRGIGGGRRNAEHEYPKQDVGYNEDMGRRARRFTVHGYVIGPDYTLDRDDLIDALEQEGPGVLILPTASDMRLVGVDTYNVTERREQGGMAEFEMNFIEAGEPPSTDGSDDTQSQSQSQASDTSSQTAAQGDADVAAQNTAPTNGAPYGPNFSDPRGPWG